MTYCLSAMKKDVNNGKLYKDEKCLEPVPLNENGVFQHHDDLIYLVSFDDINVPKEDDTLMFYCFRSAFNGNLVSSKVEFKYDDVIKA